MKRTLPAHPKLARPKLARPKMIRPELILLLLAMAPMTAHAAPGGLLRTLLKGYWVCETKGDAATAPTRLLPDSFRVIADSSYQTTNGEVGTYLLLGNDLVMTTGPFRTRKYILVGQGILHPLDTKGKRTTNRCVRQSNASALEAGTDRENDAKDVAQ
jgi:hypothetical protein